MLDWSKCNRSLLLPSVGSLWDGRRVIASEEEVSSGVGLRTLDNRLETLACFYV